MEKWQHLVDSISALYAHEQNYLIAILQDIYAQAGECPELLDGLIAASLSLPPEQVRAARCLPGLFPSQEDLPWLCRGAVCVAYAAGKSEGRWQAHHCFARCQDAPVMRLHGQICTGQTVLDYLAEDRCMAVCTADKNSSTSLNSRYTEAKRT